MKLIDLFESKNADNEGRLALISKFNVDIPVQANVFNALKGVNGLSGHDEEKQKFSKDVEEYVHQKSFLQELSDKIGEPEPNETQEQFVNRASNILRNMLYERFSIKK